MTGYSGKVTNSLVRNAKALRSDIDHLNYRYKIVKDLNEPISGPLEGVAADGIAELRALHAQLTELLASSK
jgi:hypothetical protein